MSSFISGIITKLFGEKVEKRYCCKDCLCKLYSVLDGEATTDEVHYLNDHIDHCKPCYNHYQIEKSVKEVIKHKLEKRPVPTDLINSIKTKIDKNC